MLILTSNVILFVFVDVCYVCYVCVYVYVYVCLSTIHGVNAFNIMYIWEQYDEIAPTSAFVLPKKHVYPVLTINHLKSFVVELRRYIIRRAKCFISMASTK